jgi:hypothetical protein
MNKDRFPRTSEADSTRPGGHHHHNHHDGHQPTHRNPRDKRLEPFCSPRFPSVSSTTRRTHLRPARGGREASHGALDWPPGTRRPLRESTQPGMVHARPTTHEDRGSRRASRAPDGRRTTHTAESPPCLARRHRGPARQHHLASTCPSVTCSRGHASRGSIWNKPIWVVWCSGEGPPRPNRLSHLSVMKIGRTGRQETARKRAVRRTVAVAEAAGASASEPDAAEASSVNVNDRRRRGPQRLAARGTTYRCVDDIPQRRKRRRHQRPTRDARPAARRHVVERQ